MPGVPIMRFDRTLRQSDQQGMFTHSTQPYRLVLLHLQANGTTVKSGGGYRRKNETLPRFRIRSR